MHAGVYADKHVGYYVTTGLVLTTDCGTINCKLKDDGVSRVDCGMFAILPLSPIPRRRPISFSR